MTLRRFSTLLCVLALTATATTGCADGGGPPDTGHSTDDALAGADATLFDGTLEGAFTRDDDLVATTPEELYRVQFPFVVAALERKGVSVEVTDQPVFVLPAADAHWQRTRWSVHVRGRTELTRLELASAELLVHWSTSVWAPEDARDIRARYGDVCMDTSAPETAAEIDDAAYARRFDGWLSGCWAPVDFAVLQVVHVDGVVPRDPRAPRPDPDPVGWIRHDIDVQSLHPYEERTSTSRTIPLPFEVRYSRQPIRLRFERIELASGDVVGIYGDDGYAVEYYDTVIGKVTPPITSSGPSVYLENRDAHVAWGFHISAYYTRAPAPAP